MDATAKDVWLPGNEYDEAKSDDLEKIAKNINLEAEIKSLRKMVFISDFVKNNDDDHRQEK